MTLNFFFFFEFVEEFTLAPHDIPGLPESNISLKIFSFSRRFSCDEGSSAVLAIECVPAEESGSHSLKVKVSIAVHLCGPPLAMPK